MYLSNDITILPESELNTVTMIHITHRSLGTLYTAELEFTQTCTYSTKRARSKGVDLMSRYHEPIQ